MFYCDQCRDREGWRSAPSGNNALAECEVCAAVTYCHDSGDEHPSSEVVRRLTAPMSRRTAEEPPIREPGGEAATREFESPAYRAGRRLRDRLGTVEPDARAEFMRAQQHRVREVFGSVPIREPGEELGRPNPTTEFGPEDMGPRPYRIGSRERVRGLGAPVVDAPPGPLEPADPTGRPIRALSPLAHLMERAVQGDGQAALWAFERSLIAMQDCDDRGSGLTAQEVARMRQIQQEAFERCRLARADLPDTTSDLGMAVPVGDPEQLEDVPREEPERPTAWQRLGGGSDFDPED